MDETRADEALADIAEILNDFMEERLTALEAIEKIKAATE